jgi:hypothetical protein
VYGDPEVTPKYWGEDQPSRTVSAGIEFIAENGGGAGVRLRKRYLRKGSKGDEDVGQWLRPGHRTVCSPLEIHDMFML